MNRLQALIRRRIVRLHHRDHAGSSGQSVAEFAVIVPIVLIILGGALDMGRLFYASVTIENAAREGAFYGSTNPRCDTSARTYCDDPGNAEWRVRNEVSGLDSMNVSFSCISGGSTVAVTDCQAGDMYETIVSTTFDLATPLLMPIFGGSLSLDTSATAVVLDDAFDPDASPAPEPTALCTVPNLIGMQRNPAHDTWVAAGFVQQNFDWPGMDSNDIVATQSIPVGWNEPCATATMTITQ